ncbi:hypothetical protein J4443_01955 [Candidatus Woesearchaeota archaeon]|nr:hypothetical protein [Candidatus Woesearchaeota archaeon]
MTFTLFKRKQNVKEKESPTPNQNGSIYRALMNGLDEIDKQGVDRVVLTIYESEPSQNATGRWLTAEKDANYYPFEMLDETEQEMIKDGKTYTVVALVRDNVGEVIRYAGSGVEVYNRTHIVPFLPRLKQESELNYVTEGGIHTGENLEQFTESVADNGWSPEAIEQRVKVGIQEYHKITRELMKQAGVYDALERMEQR